jgi:hypothetical protein
MANARRSHRLPKPNRRRALTLLASSRDGCTEAIMMAHEFTVEKLAELVQTGLAIASPQRTLVVGAPLRSSACGLLMQDGGCWRIIPSTPRGPSRCAWRRGDGSG